MTATKKISPSAQNASASLDVDMHRVPSDGTSFTRGYSSIAYTKIEEKTSVIFELTGD